MSSHAPIHAYRSEVEQIRRFSGSVRETAVRRAVFNLINACARPRDLLLCEELDYRNLRRGKTVRPDGTLKNTLRLDYGCWESKDTDDDFTDAIAKKFDRGYSDFNILFEDCSRMFAHFGGILRNRWREAFGRRGQIAKRTQICLAGLSPLRPASQT